MSTLTEDYRTQQLQEHNSPRAKRARAKAKVAGEHQAKARLDHATHETHNQAERASSRSAYPLDTGTRKSSRGGANRTKADSSMRKTVTVLTSSPGMRAGRSKEGGGKRKGR